MAEQRALYPADTIRLDNLLTNPLYGKDKLSSKKEVRIKEPAVKLFLWIRSHLIPQLKHKCSKLKASRWLPERLSEKRCNTLLT